MILYDQGTSVDWFYTGSQTYDEMKADPFRKALTEVPCVLYDNGAGKVYSFEPLESVCARWAVPYTGNPERDFSNLTSAMAGAYKAPGVAEAQATADEAKQMAEQAGSDPQVQTIARLAMPSIDFAEVSATDVVAIPDYIPEWSTLIGQQLKHNSPCRYNGTIYRASQDVTVQEIYPPDVAGESQYYPIEVAPDGIIVYRTCHGKYDAVRLGEYRHYPDADGPVYRSLKDWNSYDPSVRPQDWELVENE